MKRYSLASVVGLACGLLASNAWAAPVEVAVGNGTVIVEPPADWEAKTATRGPTIEMAPREKGDFKVLITPLVVKDKAILEDAELQKTVRARGEQMLPTATQKSLELRVVKGAETRGYVYHLTDRKPEKGPGDYRELHQGAVVVGPILASVTVLTHTGDDAVVEAALTAIAGMRYREGTAKAAGDSSRPGVDRPGL